MKISPINIIAIMFVVIAVALAGCSSTSPSAPAAGGAPAATTAAGAPSAPSSGGSGSAVSGADLFSGLSYNWVEYKVTAGGGVKSIYYKWTQAGECSIWTEGAEATPMDCSTVGGSKVASSDPNYVSPDAQVSCSPLPETVIVPAGSFSATKCTITSPDGNTATSWVVKDRFMVKLESSSGGRSAGMVLNAYE